MRFHRNQYYAMRGGGVGSVFTNIFNKLYPITKAFIEKAKDLANTELGQRVSYAAKRTAVDAGLDMANDALSGTPIKSAVKKNLKLSKLRKTFAENLDKSKKKSKRGGRKIKKNKKMKTKKLKYKKPRNKKSKKPKKRNGKKDCS